MNLGVIFRWADFAPAGISEAKKKFRGKFREILPKNSHKSFDYHFVKYTNMYAGEWKETVDEEVHRFGDYLKFTYERPE